MTDGVALFQNVYTKEEVLGGLYFAAALITKTAAGRDYFKTADLEETLAKLLEVGRRYACHHTQNNRKERKKIRRGRGSV